MTRSSFSSLRVRLLLLVLLAVLPAFGLIIYTFNEQRQLAIYQAQQETVGMLLQASNEEEKLIEKTHQLLKVMARSPEVQSGDPAACHTLFNNLLQGNSHYIGLAIVKPDGKLFCSVPPAGSPVNYSDRAYFQRVLKTHDFTIGDYAISRVTGKPTLHFSYPVLDETGQIKSVLIAGIDLTWLGQMMAERELPKGTSLTVIDRNGTVLSRFPYSGEWVGKSVTKAPIVQAILSQQGEGKFEGVGLDGTKHFFAFRPLYSHTGSKDVYIYTGIPFDSAFAGVYRMLIRNLAGLGLITAMILAIAWVGSNRFVIRQVDCLLGVTRQFAAGDLSARTGLAYDKGELGRLAQSFDKMAEALEKLTRKNELILNSAGEGIFGMDQCRRTTFINPVAAKMLGYEVDELLDRKSHEIFHHSKPDGSPYPEEDCPICMAIKDGAVHQVAGEVFWRKDGSSFPVEYVSTPIKEQDKVVGTVVIFKDITERRQMDKALRESEEKYRAIFETTGTGTAIIEEDTTVSLINTELEKLFGCSKEEVEVRKSWTEFILKDDLERLKEYHQMQRDDPGAVPRNYDFRLVDRLGKVKDIIATTAMIPGTKKSVVSFLDITERNQVEAELQKSSHRYRLLAQNLKDVIWSMDMNLRYTYISPSVTYLLGCSVEEAMKNTLDMVTPVSREIAIKAFEEELAIEEMDEKDLSRSLTLELEFIRKDGSTVWTEVHATFMRDPDGRPLEIIGVTRDISERKLTEDRIHRDAARAKALAEISQALTGAGLDYKGVLDTVARRTAEIIGDASVVCLLSDDGQWLNPAAFHHSNPEASDLMRKVLAAAPVRVDDGLFNRVMQTGQPLLINFTSPEKTGSLIKPEYWPYLERFGSTSLLLAPLRLHGGRVIGTLGLSRDNSGQQYTADDQAFLQDLADRVALAIDNSSLYCKNLQQLKTITALYTSSQKLGQSLNLRELAEDVTQSCVETFGARLAWLGRAEGDGRVYPLASYPMAEYLDQIGVHWDDSPLGQGAVGRAIRKGSPVIITDIAGDPNYIVWRDTALEKGFCCAAAFPLVSRNKSFGGLLLYSDQPGFFTPERVEFFQAYANQASAALENARLFEEGQRRFEHLQALRNIDMAITGSLDLRVTLNVVLDQVTNQLGIDVADILLLNPHTQTLKYAAGRGFRSRAIERSRLRLGEGYAGRAVLERRIISIANLNDAGDSFLRAPLLANEDFIAYYGIPLIAKGQVKGLLEIFHRTALDPDPEWLEFLETLAGQAAIAIDNAELFDGLQRSNIELTLAYDTTIEGLSYALDLRDKETEGHSKRVTDTTLQLARTMGLSVAELVHIRRGALLHDIGKLGIPDHILLKSGQLSDEEWEIMRKHPVYAFEMLSPINHLRLALDIPYCHHEKWDGTGYPRGLKGEQIPLSARLFAVVDLWDALHSDRPYRHAWPKDKIREYIREQAGKHFDPKVVKYFLEME